MVVFISELEDLRREMYENSLQMIELLRNRKNIAARIGKIKEEKCIDIRNREQEIKILKKLGNDGFTETVLNLLFEYSIHFENHKEFKINIDYNKKLNGKNYFLIECSRQNSLFILPFVLNPGSVIACENGEISDILSSSGHHIINNRIENEDITVSISNNAGDIIIDSHGILISENFIENKEHIYSINVV